MKVQIRLIAFSLFSWLTLAGASAQTTLNVMTKSELDQAIHDYIMENPEVIARSMEILQQRMNRAAAAEEQARVAASMAQLHNDPADVVVGNPAGDVTLVEFFDYNCHYCKNAVEDVIRLIEDDKNLRVVLKEYPILGQPSVEAATVAIALHEQLTAEKFAAFHTELMRRKGPITKDVALELAVAAGADLPKLTAALTRPEIQAELQKTTQLGRTLGVTGTPGFFIGTEHISGAIGYDAMKAKITAMRKCGASTCS